MKKNENKISTTGVRGTRTMSMRNGTNIEIFSKFFPSRLLMEAGSRERYKAKNQNVVSLTVKKKKKQNRMLEKGTGT